MSYDTDSVAIVTFAIGETYLAEYNKLFRPSVTDYCKRNNYDLFVLEDYLDNTMKHKDMISLNKLLVCNQEWTKGYKFIVILDADILINPLAPAIHTFMDNEKKIGIIDEYSQPNPMARLELQKANGWETSAHDYYKLCAFDLDTTKVLNGGLLVCNPKLHGEFLYQVYERYKGNQIGHYRGYHYEQSCTGYEIQKANMYNLLSNKFNTIWPLYKPFGVNLKDLYNNSWFLHFAGHCDYDSIPTLTRIQ
jgi:hypothetical protein